MADYIHTTVMYRYIHNIMKLLSEMVSSNMSSGQIVFRIRHCYTDNRKNKLNLLNSNNTLV